MNTNSKTYIPEYCYILAFGIGKVFKHLLKEDEVDINTEELLNKYGLNEDECHIMYSTDELELEPLED